MLPINVTVLYDTYKHSIFVVVTYPDVKYLIHGYYLMSFEKDDIVKLTDTAMFSAEVFTKVWDHPVELIRFDSTNPVGNMLTHTCELTDSILFGDEFAQIMNACKLPAIRQKDLINLIVKATTTEKDGLENLMWNL